MIDFLTRIDTFGMILRNHHRWLLELVGLAFLREPPQVPQ